MERLQGLAFTPGGMTRTELGDMVIAEFSSLVALIPFQGFANGPTRLRGMFMAAKTPCLPPRWNTFLKGRVQQSKAIGMLSILGACAILKILWAIVHLVTIYVIDFVSFRSRPKEGCCNQNMDRTRLDNIVLREMHHQVLTPRDGAQYTASKCVAVGLISAHLAEIRNTIDSLVTRELKPSLLHRLIVTTS